MSATSQVAVTDAASLVAEAHDALNRYFAAELGRSFSLPAPAVLERQRQAFVARFGPEALAALDDAALLRELPPNGQGDLTMDYWLEFKNDETFDQRLFGSIAGGAATKFGTWQDRQTGNWRAKQPDAPQIQIISEAEALMILRQRRAEMLAAMAMRRPCATWPR
jgi:5-methylcytosine-specific restriction protein B